MKNRSLSSPNRLPIEGLAIIFFRAIYRWGRAIWPILVIYVLKSSQYQAYKTHIYIGLGLILLFSIIHAILAYKHFNFQIKDGEFIVNSGYINKEKKSIPLERIQTVNIKQNIVQQIIGVVQLEVDTAGSKEKELSLPALRKDHAKELENILLSKKKEEETEEEEAEETIIEEEKNNTLFKLSIYELIKIAISDNIFKGGLLALSFTYGIYQQYNEIIKERFANEIDSIQNTANSASWQLIVFAIGVFILFSIILSVIRIVLINFELKVSQTPQAYKLEKGLFNKKSVIIPLSKIQTYTWTSNPIRQFFNIVTINIKQASSNDVKEKNAVDIPGCQAVTEQNIRKEIFNDSTIQEYDSHKTQAFYFMRSWAIIVLIPTIVIPFFVSTYSIIAGLIVWNILVSTMLYKGFKKRKYLVSKDYMIVQKGSISTSNKIFSLYKVQAVSFKQSIFMKRKGRANLIIYTASERIAIPFISEQFALETYNYILYKIEKKNRPFM